MLTQEEIKIKMGIETGEVMKGIDRVSNYVEKWKNKRKTSEEEYSSWWAQELKKRDESEITAAARRNQARALWRKRAADRELRIARDQAAQEKIIQDQNAIAAANSRSLITLTAMKSLGNKAMSLLKTNVYLAAADLVSSIIPTWQEIWDGVYGVDDDSTGRLKESSDNLRKLREQTISAQKELADAKAKAVFDDSGQMDQFRMLQQRKLVADVEAKAAKDQVVLIQKRLSVPMTFGEREGLLGKLGGAQASLSKAELEQFNAGRDITLASKKLPPEIVAQMFASMLSDSIPDVATLRTEFKNQMALRNASNRNGMFDAATNAGEAAKQSLDGLNMIAKTRAITGMGNLANSVGNVPFFGAEMAKAITDAQLELMRNMVQKVKIVEIE